MNIRIIFKTTATALAVAFVVYSCKGNLSEAEKLDLDRIPVQTVDGMFFVQSENGRLKMRVEAPRMEVYEHDTLSYDLFPKGLKVFGYKEDGTLETTIISDKARHDKYPGDKERWSAFGLLSSHSRLHGSNSYRVPWNFDEESVDVLRAFTRLKMRLVPYLWRAALQAHGEGLPVLRPMVLAAPGDPACLHLDHQYMLGDDLLVAPVFNPQGIGEFYVPEGEAPWTDWFAGERFEPGRWYRREVPYDRIPLLVRPGAVVAVGACDERPDYDWAAGATFRVFEPRPGSRGEIFDRAGALVASLDVAEIPGGFEFRLGGGSGGSAPRSLRIALANLEPASVEGATLSREGFFAVLSDCAPVVRAVFSPGATQP